MGAAEVGVAIRSQRRGPGDVLIKTSVQNFELPRSRSSAPPPPSSAGGKSKMRKSILRSRMQRIFRDVRVVARDWPSRLRARARSPSRGRWRAAVQRSTSRACWTPHTSVSARAPAPGMISLPCKSAARTAPCRSRGGKHERCARTKVLAAATLAGSHLGAFQHARDALSRRREVLEVHGCKCCLQHASLLLR